MSLTEVVISAAERDKKMWQTLPEVLSEHFPAVLATRHGPLAVRENPELVICDTDTAERVESEQTVIIYKDILGSAPPELRDHPAVAVVDASNSRVVEYVGGTGLPAITCGLSSRDTLTLTSIGADSAVLGLQRSVDCFDGTVAEPQEIPLQLRGPMDSFTLMAAASVFILSGRLDDLRAVKF